MTPLEKPGGAQGLLALATPPGSSSGPVDPGPGQAGPLAAHLDFKRSGAGWLVWCERDWQDVVQAGEMIFCSCCDADLNDRIKAVA